MRFELLLALSFQCAFAQSTTSEIIIPTITPTTAFIGTTTTSIDIQTTQSPQTETTTSTKSKPHTITSDNPMTFTHLQPQSTGDAQASKSPSWVVPVSVCLSVFGVIVVLAGSVYLYNRFVKRERDDLTLKRPVPMATASRPARFASYPTMGRQNGVGFVESNGYSQTGPFTQAPRPYYPS